MLANVIAGAFYSIPREERRSDATIMVPCR
jgi:hypothetical protein